MRICILIIVALFFLGACKRLVETKDVFWSSIPVNPGEIAILYGHNLALTSLLVSRIPDIDVGIPPAREPLLLSKTSVATIQPRNSSLKFELPSEMKPGLFAIELESSRPIYILNRPQIYWVQGEAGDKTWPGSMARVQGLNLVCPSHEPKIYFEGPSSMCLSADGDAFTIEVILPDSILPGIYNVYATNGWGGPSGWSEPTTLQIVPRPSEPTTIIDIMAMGAVGNGVADDTIAIEAALHAVSGEGSTVIYFPAGTYRVTRPFDLPPYSILRGGGRDSSSIKWDIAGDTTSRYKYVLWGSHDFAIEDLSLQFPVSEVENGILSDLPRPWPYEPVLTVIGEVAGNIALRRLRIVWELDEFPPEDLSEIPGYGAKGFLVLVGGHNIQVIDNELESAESVINLMGNDIYVTHNICQIGQYGWAFNLSGAERVVAEYNTFVGGHEARNGASFWSSAPNKNIYFAHNEIEDVTYFDCEGITTDGSAGRYFGSIASATSDSVSLPAGSTWKYPNQSIVGTTCYVISGRGKGQYRHITSGTCTSVDGLDVVCTAQLDKPWNVIPDFTSTIGINHTVDHILIVENRIVRANKLQLYGSAYEVTFSGNEAIDSGGLFSYSNRYPGVSTSSIDTQPQFFIQWIDNYVEGGVASSCPNHDTTKVGLNIVAGNSGQIDWSWPMIQGFVIRRNALSGEAGIVIRSMQAAVPLIQDVIIENNMVSDNITGVSILNEVNGIVTRGNIFNMVTYEMEISKCSEIFIQENIMPVQPIPVDKPITIEPSGIIYDTTPTYVWHSICDAAEYNLYVKDGAGNLVINLTYTASELGCADGGLCSLTSFVELAYGDQGVWMVQGGNDRGQGPWAVEYFTLE